MSGLTHLRLAALCALTYGLLVVSGLVQHFYRTGSFRVLGRNLANPWLWAVVLLAVVLTYGLWKRQAWAWWLAIAAGSFQIYRIAHAWFAAGWRTPPTSTLILLALLVLMIVLLLPRKARLAANR